MKPNSPLENCAGSEKQPLNENLQIFLQNKISSYKQYANYKDFMKKFIEDISNDAEIEKQFATLTIDDIESVGITKNAHQRLILNAISELKEKQSNRERSTIVEFVEKIEKSLKVLRDHVKEENADLEIRLQTLSDMFGAGKEKETQSTSSKKADLTAVLNEENRAEDATSADRKVEPYPAPLLSKYEKQSEKEPQKEYDDYEASHFKGMSSTELLQRSSKRSRVRTVAVHFAYELDGDKDEMMGNLMETMKEMKMSETITLNRINMVDEDFQLDNFTEFRQSREFNVLENDWPQVEAMFLDREKDRKHFDPYYEESQEIADCSDSVEFLLLKMYTSKYGNLITKYPTIENYLKVLILSTEFIRQRDAENEQLTADVLYKELIDFDGKISLCRMAYAPADFAVLFIKNRPTCEKLKFWKGAPRETSYRGVRLSFSRSIVCRVRGKHLELPESLGNCIVSMLPGKHLTRKINERNLPTPYSLSSSWKTKQISIGPGPEVIPKPIFSLRLCSIPNLDIFLYDNDHLDIRTFADKVYTWYKNVTPQ